MPTLLQVATSSWGGGLELIVRNLARAAASQGWRSVVVHWREEPRTESGVEYYRLPLGRVVRRWPWELARFVRELEPDVVHLHGPSAGSLGALALRATGTNRFLYTDHFVHRDRPLHIRIARRLTARLPTLNVAPSQEVADSLTGDARVPHERIVVVRCGVEEAPAATPPVPDAPPRFICVANLWARKGHVYLLEAVARARSPIAVTLIGDGPERDALSSRVRELAIGHLVELAGFRDDPWSMADGAHGYVHPSLGEGMPLAVMEAMMRGLPVIATPVGGVPEMVTEATGFLVPPRDAAALAEAMERLIEGPQERDRLAKGARAFALQQLSMASCAEAYLSLYERLRFP